MIKDTDAHPDVRDRAGYVRRGTELLAPAHVQPGSPLNFIPLEFLWRLYCVGVINPELNFQPLFPSWGIGNETENSKFLIMVWFLW